MGDSVRKKISLILIIVLFTVSFIIAQEIIYLSKEESREKEPFKINQTEGKAELRMDKPKYEVGEKYFLFVLHTNPFEKDMVIGYKWWFKNVKTNETFYEREREERVVPVKSMNETFWEFIPKLESGKYQIEAYYFIYDYVSTPNVTKEYYYVESDVFEVVG